MPAEWKIHLTMSVYFMSSKDNDDKQLMHSISDAVEIIISNEVEEIIKQLLHWRVFSITVY